MKKIMLALSAVAAFTGSALAADMAPRTYAKAPAFMESPRIYGDYGLLLSDVLYGAYNLDTSPRKRLLPTGLAAFRKSPLKVTHLVKDIFSAMRSL